MANHALKLLENVEAKALDLARDCGEAGNANPRALAAYPEFQAAVAELRSWMERLVGPILLQPTTPAASPVVRRRTLRDDAHWFDYDRGIPCRLPDGHGGACQPNDDEPTERVC